MAEQAQQEEVKAEIPSLQQEGSSQLAALKIKTNDGIVTEVNSQFANMSKYVKHMIEDFDKTQEIPVDCEKKYLDLIIQYCEHHEYKEMPRIPKPIPSSDMKELVHDQWDAEFVNALTREDWYKLVLAINPLDIKCLLDLVCTRIAADFRDMTWEDMKQIFGVTEDLTPEIEQEILKEFPWAADDSEEDLLAGREEYEKGNIEV